MLDLPLLAVVSATVAALLESENFQRKSWVIVAALLVCAGFLVKVNYGAFIVGPALYCAWTIWQQRLRNVVAPAVVWWIFGVGATALLLIFLFPDYINTQLRFFSRLRGSAVIPTWTSEELMRVPLLVHKIRSVAWYIWGFINWQAGFLWFLALAVGVVAALRSREEPVRNVLVWGASGAVILCWYLYAIDLDMEVTGVRYSLPLLGAAALLTAYGLTAIRVRWIRNSVIATLCGISLMQNVCRSYPVLTPDIHVSCRLSQDRYHLLPGELIFFSTRPLIISGSNWDSRIQDKSAIYQEVERVYRRIAACADFPEKATVVYLADDPHWWHLGYLQWRSGGNNLEFLYDYSRNWAPIFNIISGAQHSGLLEAEFVLDIVSGATEPYKILTAFRLWEVFVLSRNNYRVIYKSDRVVLYRRLSAEQRYRAGVSKTQSPAGQDRLAAENGARVKGAGIESKK